MILLDTVLPGLPPALNHAYTHTAGGGKRMTDAAAAWQAGATLAFRAAVQHPAPDPRARLVVRVMFTSPRILAWDLDGRCKQLIDALSAAIGVDDRYIMRLTISKTRGQVASTAVLVEEAL